MKHSKPQDPEFYYIDRADYRRKVDDYTAIEDTWISTEKGLPHIVETVLAKVDYDGGYVVARRVDFPSSADEPDEWHWVRVDTTDDLEQDVHGVVTDWKRILAPVRDVNGK